MEKIYVVIVPVDYHNSRTLCERIKNQNWETLVSLNDFLYKEGINGSSGDVLYFNLSEFIDGVNNQELDVLTESFISYVKIGK